MNIKPSLGKYKHYKGGIYNVIAIAEHTEDGSTMVVYIDKNNKTWCRPLDMFAGKVIGTEVDRFTKID